MIDELKKALDNWFQNNGNDNNEADFIAGFLKAQERQPDIDTADWSVGYDAGYEYRES